MNKRKEITGWLIYFVGGTGAMFLIQWLAKMMHDSIAVNAMMIGLFVMISGYCIYLDGKKEKAEQELFELKMKKEVR